MDVEGVEMVGDREPLTGCRIIGDEVVQEEAPVGRVWVKYVYVRGWSDDLMGLADKIDGWTGPETRFRRVIVKANATFDVAERQLIAA
jgi:hypothetical protein